MLHDGQIEYRQLLADDAAAHCLPAALALPAAIATEAGVAWRHQQVHAAGSQDTLLHGEALLVLATHDLEDVPLELLQTSEQEPVLKTCSSASVGCLWEQRAVFATVCSLRTLNEREG